MLKTLIRRALPLAILAATGLAGPARAEPSTATDPVLLAARPNAHPEHAMLLGAARAGQRIVAVGDHGTIALSDDDGKTFRQARQVPVRAMLNAVAFVDDKHGWAVGHRGMILATADGGETWALQRKDLEKDQPLFSVYFRDTQNGWACGLWSLLLETHDGGRSWQAVSLPVPEGAKRADRNLYGVFADPHGTLFIAAEQGKVLRSKDSGAHWETLDTGYKGSLWSGIALADGTLMVGGLRGALYHSQDGGSHWETVKVPTLSSITAFATTTSGVVASALDGVVLTSKDSGRHFDAAQRADRQALTGVITTPRGPLLFSKAGVLSGD